MSAQSATSSSPDFDIRSVLHRALSGGVLAAAVLNAGFGGWVAMTLLPRLRVSGLLLAVAVLFLLVGRGAREIWHGKVWMYTMLVAFPVALTAPLVFGIGLANSGHTLAAVGMFALWALLVGALVRRIRSTEGTEY